MKAAVASIPAYVALSSLVLVLAPSCTHLERKEKQKKRTTPQSQWAIADKQLLRPTYSFIQWVVRAVLRLTGFPRGLFTPQELGQNKRQQPQQEEEAGSEDAEDVVKEEAVRLDFLAKLINCVSYGIGSSEHGCRYRHPP